MNKALILGLCTCWLAGTTLAAMETVSFTSVDSQATSGLVSYNATLAGGYTLGTIDWSGLVTPIEQYTYGNELMLDISGPLGSATIQLGSGTSYYPGPANFTGISSLFNNAGDPAGNWTFDFYESYDDGADGLADATWNSIDFGFSAYAPETWPGFQGFESGVPPAGWTSVQNNPYTWETAASSPYEGVQHAVCYYDDTYSGPQREWMLSPSATAVAGMELSGQTYGSIYWGTPPEQGGTYDNYDLEAWIIRGADVDDGDDTFLGLLDDSWVSTWNWAGFYYNLDDYGLTPGEDFRIGFCYDGYDGAEGSIDAVNLTPEPTAALLLGLAGLLLRRR